MLNRPAADDRAVHRLIALKDILTVGCARVEGQVVGNKVRVTLRNSQKS